ncbi:MAG TPA: cytidylate kinase, partial [Synergistaceae bacterium]|nr:cytidylate kinase [Synergistaceae bacterium]
RDALIGFQRGQASEGLVADGRDMGTVVFPDADLKIFLTADAEERARRRYKERVERGENADFDEILKYVNERDLYDMNREIAPLRPAPGCV